MSKKSQHEIFQGKWFAENSEKYGMPQGISLAKAVKILVEENEIAEAIQLLFGRSKEETEDLLKDIDLGRYQQLYSVDDNTYLILEIARNHKWVDSPKEDGLSIQVYSNPDEILHVGGHLGYKLVYELFPFNF